MPRKQVDSPLQGAIPGLQPVARPLSIPIGATPAPSSSPLMQLGEAFREFNPELRDMLRDAAAREERDALALGELEAQKTNAAQRMGQIEDTLKKAVDSGQVSHVRLPAFERGFRSRVGRDLAQSVFQERLLQQLPDAMRVEGRADPEKLITDTYAQVAQQIHPDDFYARAAFDETAKGVMAGFRQRAAEGYTAEYKKAAEQRIADEGSEIAFRLASAAEADAPALRDSVRAHLDEVRKELPKSEVNGFYVKNVVAPAVDKLVSERKFTEARHLMDEMERLDVTGNGGLLSQTSVAKAAFSDMRAKVERDTRAAEYESYTNLRRERETLTIKGEDEAAAALNELRLKSGGTLSPSDRFRLIDEYRKAHPGEPLKTQGFASAVHREFDGEDKWRTNDRAISDLEVSIKSLRKEDIESGRARLDALYAAGEIPPSARTRLSQHIDKLEALYGAIDEGDFNRFKKDLYAAPGLAGQKTINFGDANDNTPNGSSRLWDVLPDNLRTEHETRVTEFFSNALQDEIRLIGDPNKVAAGKAQALDRATVKTRDYARTLLRDLNRQKIEAETQNKVEKQAQRIRSASIDSGLGERPPPLGTGFAIPGKKANEGGLHLAAPMLAEGYPNPGPEADELTLYVPAASLKEWLLPGAAGSSRRIVMSELGQDIKDNPDEKKAQKSRDLYAYVKGRLGFTPEEVKNGVTKDGVSFLPSAIDPAHITVFRNKAELEKHWANGQPSELFLQLGDAIDPSDKLTSEQFYLAQAALLTRR